MPAERGLLQPIQCFFELHDLGPDSISQNLGWTHIRNFFQWGTHERVRDVQAVHYTILTGSDAEDDTNDSQIGDGCVRLIEVEAMYLSISASNKAALYLMIAPAVSRFVFRNRCDRKMFIPGWCGTMVQVPASLSALTSLSIASIHLSLLIDAKAEEIVGESGV
jgi:hypothetical protein